MKTHEGALPRAVMHQFPSWTAADTVPNWVANHAGLEQVLGVAGLLDPDLHEVRGHVFWSREAADYLARADAPESPVGNDPASVERYYNLVNLREFFLEGFDEAAADEAMQQQFGAVLERLWQRALQCQFPERRYLVEISRDLYGEDGLCLTFWQDRADATSSSSESTPETVMKTRKGVLPLEVMHRFPLRAPPATHDYADWLANFAGLEQVLGVAGLLDPDFHEVRGHVFWSCGVAEGFERVGVVGTPFGDDPVTVERYSNIVNLEEFFLAAAHEAVDSDELLAWFAVVLERFWQRALRAHFPERRYLFEVTRSLYDEDGLCLTFWQDRSLESA